MKRTIALLLPLVLVLMLILPGCGGRNLALECVLTEEPITLDPQVAEDENAKIAITALFEGLTRLDENNEPIPGVAERWDVSPDGTVYTFYLRSDAVWEDEVPVTAADFVYGFQRSLLPETNSPTCRSLFCIRNAREVRNGSQPPSELGVKAQNDHTLEITLNYPNKDFLRLTASAPCMPCREDYFTKTEGKYGMESRTTLGNGPFRMENIYSWEHDAYINLIRSETYHGNYAPAPRKLTLTIADADTEPNPVRWLNDGATCAAKIPLSAEADLAESGYSAVRYPETTWGILFNTKAKPVKSTDNRMLLLQALDRDALLILRPKGTAIARSILPPSASYHGRDYRSQVNALTLPKQDLSKSKDAGSKVPVVTILCPDTESGRRIANAMITAWNPVFHHYYNMEPVSENELERRIQSGDYEVAIAALTADADDPAALLNLFHSKENTNPAGFQDQNYDKLVTLPYGTGSTQFLNHCQQAEQFLLDEAVFYPLYYEDTVYAAEKGLREIQFLPNGMGIDFIQAAK